ncbi:MAG: hypothetical protein JWM64_2178 [Frankiales bacterium]|nr:hypothetical protein [Frankiales bacterium]
MTSTLAGPAVVDDGLPAARPRATLTGLDLLAGGALLVVSLVAWASLALAHVGHHSVPGVAALTLVALAAGALLVARRAPFRVRADLPGVVVALGCAAVAAALTFPGFSYGVVDKDPGVYVAHAAEISRTGSFSFVDPVLASGAPVQLLGPGARLGGIWVHGAKDADGSCGNRNDGCLIIPQFYHLWPALLATSYDLGGHSALFWTVPVPAVLSVLLMVAVLRRVADALLGVVRAGGQADDRAPPGLAGLAAGLAGGLLLATNMLQVWQSRFPTTEVLAQSLYLGALLGIVVALQTGWRPAAGLAGLWVGIGWLNRADGVLLVVMAVGVGALLLAVRRWDGRAWWAAAGLGIVLPHALRQAYDYAAFYSQANDVPSKGVLAAVCVALLLAGAAVGVVDSLVVRRRGAGLVALAQARRAQLVLGVLVVLGAAGLLALGYLRPRLFGEARFDYLGRDVRSFDEQIMKRLTWFFTLPGFAVMLAGVAVVGLRRWRASVWAVVLPTLVLFPLYAYNARNSTRLLWWTRRYVPTVMPGILLLVALALAFAVVWRFRGRALLRVPAVLVLGGLVAVFLSQSLPLRSHDEWDGSVEVAEQVSALSPGKVGLYLWEPNQGCCTGPTQLFSIPVWLAEGELSVLLPGDPAIRARTIADYRKVFPDMPVFVVADKGQLPDGIDPAAVTPVLDRRYALPMWEESDFERPDEAKVVRGQLSVWRLTGT